MRIAQHRLVHELVVNIVGVIHNGGILPEEFLCYAHCQNPTWMRYLNKVDPNEL